jgi:hypothetical protein
MRNLILGAAAILAVSGCIVDTEETASDDVTQESSDSPQYLGGHGGNHWPACQGHVEVVLTPDGEEVAFMLPAFCNPFYIYKGYPNPVDTNPVDNNPFEQEIGFPEKEIDFEKESSYYE